MLQLFYANLVTVATIGVCICACIAWLHISERFTSRIVVHAWGWRGVLVTGWLGVPLHELSHLLLARLFRHRIVSFSLFDPDPVSGTLGYVRHAESKNSTIQKLGNFWIGIAPVLAGSTALILLIKWMAPHLSPLFDHQLLHYEFTGLASLFSLTHSATQSACKILLAVWRERTRWLPLQLYLAVAVAAHMAPSIADLKATAGSLLLLLLIITVCCGITARLHITLADTVAIVPYFIIVAILVTLFNTLWILVAKGMRKLAGG